MSKQPLAIIILAAGQGTRMKSPLPKVLHPLAGLPMITWLLQSCEQLEPEKIIVVRSPDLDFLDEIVAPHETAIQEEQNGTGDAVKAALPKLEGFDGRVLILMGDEPFAPITALQHMAQSSNTCVMGFAALNPHGMGRFITTDQGHLTAIVEDKDCTEEQRDITLCNGGNYGVSAEDLRNWIPQIESNNAQSEFYLTDLIAIATKDGQTVEPTVIQWEGPWGINTQTQLAAHEKMIQNALRTEMLEEGVHMIDPESVHFNFDTKIEPGVSIEPNVFFGSGVHVESGTKIRAFSHIEGTHIKAGATIGPFARIRPGSEIGEGAKVGNFAEINRSIIGPESKVSHHSYVGDTQMGENVNFSAGAITANYDGKDKYKTMIGDNVMVGTNVNLVAPLIIEDDAFIAAGSTITENVPAKSLAIARTKKTTIKNK